MPVSPLATVSVADALVRALRDRVLDGDLPAGAVVAETEVATRYGVSRPTAKSAIAVLVHEGLLRRDMHKPAHVSRLSPHDVQDLFLVRVPLELEVVRFVLASGRVPGGVAGAVTDLRAVPEDAPHSRFVEADLRFHRLLVDTVDSPRLTRLYRTITGEIHLSMVQSRYALGRERIAAEHAAVLAALERGDQRAVELMRAHLEGACAALARAQAG